ncbi:hypothetical protein [Nannocystis sp. SCPEA4]|uniref:hypothetical protein n=1 Tax=Nannocystis sp. SCPEA4 TaxID=2996787 RepID=UPI0022708614|nr:hypothetical protein [Nannocystis sp. SCPEA4]MCY1060206.1 hypothetical protein [Nannocystis sp. SCPEA4]
MTISARQPFVRLAAFALLGLACIPPTEAPDLPLCPALEVASPTGAPPPPSLWLTLLLHGYDAEARRAAAPLRACSGESIAPPPDPCDPVSEPPAAIEPLDDRAIVFGAASEGELLVWVTTHRSPTGDALGPIALVRQRSTSIAVHALGMLEAPPGGAVLSVRDAGAGAARRRYLVVEGERCPEADPGACVREARILPLDGPRFVPSAYHDANDACIESPRLPLFRRVVVPGAPSRAVVDRRLISADESGLFVHEELEFYDDDRLLRRAAETRRIDYRGGRLIVDAPSLYSRLSADSPEDPA